MRINLTLPSVAVCGLCIFLKVLTAEEAERRGQMYDQQGVIYLFDLDYVADVFTVDAAHYGNIPHFVNHSVSVTDHVLIRCHFAVFQQTITMLTVRYS